LFEYDLWWLVLRELFVTEMEHIGRLEGLLANQLLFVSRLISSSSTFKEKLPNRSWINLLMNITGQTAQSGTK